MRGNEFDRLLQKRFGTGKRFTESYLNYFESAQNVSLRSDADLNALSPAQRMWFEYAMSTNQRGADLMRVLESHKDLSRARYLDIGCGFGGCLVAAAQRGAFGTGIEIDPERAAFSRQNVADFALEIPILDLDALSPNLRTQIGTFDVITCNDVAEHVESASKLLLRLSDLLNPGGIAYLEIPNGDCIDFVAHDGHFGLFGITLLDRERARQYHWEHFGCAYDVGEYWSLEQYYAFFAQAGLRVQLIPSLYHPARPLSELEPQLAILESARVPDIRLDEPYRAYRDRLAQDRSSLHEEAFRNRYLRNFWTFLATPQSNFAK